MVQKLHLITVATDKKLYMDFLIESIKRNNGELIILGLGEKWKGFNWRNKLVLDFINTLDNNDVVCFIDGYDVVCIRDLNQLIDTFNDIKQREKCKMIVGYENQLNIFNWLMAQMIFGNCNGKSLNAGTYISSVIDLKEIIQNILANNTSDDSDDQILLTNYCNANPSDIYIDNKVELFLALVDSSKELNYDNYVVNNQIIYNSQKPFFIHAPGGTCMDNLIKKIGYDVNEGKICDKIIKNNYNKSVHYTWVLIDLIGIYILVIIFLIYILVNNTFYKVK